jgi:multidrug transporter EmrE-like cation transporter
MMTWLWIALAAGLNSAALVLMRFAGRDIHWSDPVFSISLTSIGWLACSALAYVLAFALTLRILAVHQFGVAVPVFVGLQFAFSFLAAWWIFRETIDTTQLLGVVLILTGVAVVAMRK